MWSLIKVACLPAALVSGVLLLYSVMKIARAEDAASEPPSEQVEIEGGEVKKLEPVRVTEARTKALTLFVGSGTALVATGIVFGYATLKGRKKL